jgi:hypothetical protein
LRFSVLGSRPSADSRQARRSAGTEERSLGGGEKDGGEKDGGEKDGSLVPIDLRTRRPAIDIIFSLHVNAKGAKRCYGCIEIITELDVNVGDLIQGFKSHQGPRLKQAAPHPLTS